MQLTLREISEALVPYQRVSLVESVEINAVASGYSIDTRTLKPGDLFFAIRGPRFDGHDFVSDAFKKGACAAVVSEDWATRQLSEKTSIAASTKRKWIVVSDTTKALQLLGARVRQWWGGQLIAITGSAGKTTTKEICARLLALSKRVYKSEGNLNNLYGVPLSLLRVDASAEIAVLELAMSARGEIRILTQIARPSVGVVTNVNPVHLQFFSSIEEIAAAKRELVEELDKNAVAVLNADDPQVRKFRSSTRAKVVTFGESTDADVRVENIQMSDLRGWQFEVVLASGPRCSCRLPLIGRVNVWNTAAAIAAVLQTGIPISEIPNGIASIQPAKMRGELLKFKEGFTVINDTYNSNPRALEEAITAVAQVNGFKRKIVVAGEMLELGPESRNLHARCGKALADAGIHILIAVQGDAQTLAAGARAAGMRAQNTSFCATSAEAGEKLCRIIAPGDLVLLKGSRGVRMELALDRLLQKFALEVS